MIDDTPMLVTKYVACCSQLSPLAIQSYLTSNRRKEKIPAIPIFLAHHKAFPCCLSCIGSDTDTLFHVSSILKYLKNEFKHDEANNIIIKTRHQKSKQFYVQTRLCDLGHGIMIHFKRVHVLLDIQNPNNYSADLLNDYFLLTPSISIYYLPDQDIKVRNMAEEFLKYYVYRSKFLKLSMICRRGSGGYHLSNIQIKKPMIYDIALHYGQNFVKVHEKILKECNKTDGKGIVLLHGIPGSGKTHYIRYLIEEIKNKKLIYVPPDMAKEISKPHFLPFLLQYPNSILIIEDAENIIRDRNELEFDASQAVANLLNLSDGLLGDATHMQIIATFNCDLSKIDKALLRKGRLIAHYEFGTIDIDDAKNLSSKLGFGIEHITAPMTLADIYNQSRDETAEIPV